MNIHFTERLRNLSRTIKYTIAPLVFIALSVSVFLTYALAGLNARPVEFSAPPRFVEQFADQWTQADLSAGQNEQSLNVEPKQVENTKVTANVAKEKEIVQQVILGGESPEILVRLFTHPQKQQRVKIAFAFAAVNAALTHDEESGFADKRTKFWEEASESIPAIKNALFEALITSAEEGTANYIPYTLAWMPGQDHQTVELLAWSAQHHPDPWVRRFSVFFVVEFGQSETLAEALLQDRIDDPDYIVRKEVLAQKVRRFKAIFGSDEQS